MKDIKCVLVIDERYDIHAFTALDDNGAVSVDGEIGCPVIVQVQHPVGIIVIHRGCQQFLHFPGIHGGIISRAQGREIICIHQVGGCHEVFRYVAIEGNCGGVILRCYRSGGAGHHLEPILGVQCYNKDSILLGGIGHRGGIPLNLKIGHGASGFVARFFLGGLLLICLDILAQQIAETVGSLDGYALSIHRSLGRLRCKCAEWYSCKQQYQDQKACYDSF